MKHSYAIITSWRCPGCGFLTEKCHMVWGEPKTCPGCGLETIATWMEPPVICGSREDWKKKLDPELDKKMGLKLREEAKNRSRRSKYVGGIG